MLLLYGCSVTCRYLKDRLNINCILKSSFITTGQPMEMWHGPWEQICRTPGLSSASEKSRARTWSRDGQRQMLRSGKGLQEHAWRPLGWEVRWATGTLTCFLCSSHRYQTKDVLDKKDSTHPGIPLYFGCNCFNCCSSDPKQATSEEH